MKKRILAAVFAALILCGCAARTEETAGAYAPAEADRVVIYTPHKEAVYAPIVKEFEERTGIWVQVVTGGTSELLEQVAAEGDAPVCDVVFGGGVESLAAYGAYFEPYICAEAVMLRREFRAKDNLWTPISALPIVLIYNTKLVSPGQLTGWSDLLTGDWQGKIAFADPTVSGSSYTAVMTLLAALPGDPWDTLERFTDALDGQILPDSGDVAAAVADGSCYVGVTLEDTALRWRNEGAEIGVVYPKEGTSGVPDGCALVSGAPHGDNARAFLDFIQSRDVQGLMVERFSRRSVRTDVMDDPALPPFDELNLLDYPLDWAAAEKEEFVERWAVLAQEAVL